MGKLCFLLTCILYVLLGFVWVVEYIPMTTKIILATLIFYYPLYPLSYFQIGWLEKMFKRWENWPYYIDIPKLVDRSIKWKKMILEK